MKKTLVAVGGAWAIAGLALSAQTPQPTQPPSTPGAPTATQPAAPTDKTDKAVTITGCLTTWNPGAAGRMGSTPPAGEATGTAGATTKYVLSNIEGGDKAAPGTAADAHKTYLLSAGSTVNLAAHINHKVQLTGAVDRAPAMGLGPAEVPPSARTPGAPGEQKPPAANMMPPTMNVTALKMISATCP